LRPQGAAAPAFLPAPSFVTGTGNHEGGLRRGENFWLHLTTVSALCLRLSERFLLLTQCHCYAPPLGRALSDYAHLTSVAYIGPRSRTERPRRTKTGTEVAHVTRDPDTTFKVKRSKVNLQGRGHIVAASDTAC